MQYMKYIVVEDYMGNEAPIIFSSSFNHDEIAKKIGLKVISAGCFKLEDVLSCYGTSTTLGISSRGKVDADLIKRQTSFDM